MMVQQIECSDCDYQLDYLNINKTEAPDCPSCGERLSYSGIVGTVFGSGNDMRPAARELVEEWREYADNSKGATRGVALEFAEQLEKELQECGMITNES